ncbi:hypothetical protein VTO42DRAFT_4912 [Malbranchea cinnamomea]
MKTKTQCLHSTHGQFLQCPCTAWKSRRVQLTTYFYRVWSTEQDFGGLTRPKMASVRRQSQAETPADVTSMMPPIATTTTTTTTTTAPHAVLYLSTDRGIQTREEAIDLELTASRERPVSLGVIWPRLISSPTPTPTTSATRTSPRS